MYARQLFPLNPDGSSEGFLFLDFKSKRLTELQISFEFKVNLLHDFQNKADISSE